MDERHALLLTDVVDSTLLAERLGDVAAAELGAAHDRMARDLLRAWRGREIDKTDGMLMLFDRAADALGCAVAYHRALRVLPVPLQARAGLHVGTLILRANPPEDVARGAKPLEVEGIAKPLAARVMSLAQAGQTLLSAEARAALGQTAWRVQSHGFWRIKGLSAPVELFEAGDEHAPFVPPPDSDKVYCVVRDGELWLPRRELRHNLPLERDAFVGRRDELMALARCWDDGARLVSLLGIGGCGKTRLALRYARLWLGGFPGGAWFCDLAQARSAAGIVQAVAQGLEVPLGKDDPVQQLGHAIAGRGPCLVILDNFEQVARHAAATLGCWLDRAAQARFLVTSREVLGLSGEQALPLAPLPPDEAQALFVRRAAAAAGGLQGGVDEAAAIAQLMRLLDGLPLAIELAAARVRSMSPRTLLARMDQRFRLLAASGARQDRQATLRTTFDWSWDLLGDAEKSTLAQLSVFEGGFTIEAAEAVVDLSSAGAAADVLRPLSALVDKSFVRCVGAARYDLLVSVRDYAEQQLRHLAGPGEQGAAAAQALQRRHGAYYVERAAAGPQAMVGELDNLVAGCRRATLQGDAEPAARALEATWSVLELQGPLQLGLELAEALLPRTAGGAHEARVQSVAGRAALSCGLRAQARRYLAAAVGGAWPPGHDPARAAAECGYGSLLADEGQGDEAQAWLDAAMARAQRADDAELLCRLGNEMALRRMNAGELAAAAALLERALDVARQMGRVRWEGGILGNLGMLAEELGRPAQAEARYGEALQIARRIGDLRFAGNTLSNLGLLEHFSGRSASARSHFDEALSIARRIGHRGLQAVTLCNLGLQLDDQGESAQALAQLEQAVAVCRELGDPRALGQCLGHLGLVHARLHEAGQAGACLREGEQLLREQADPVSLALLLCARAEAEQLVGRCADLGRHYAEAEALARSAGTGADSELGRALGRVRRLVTG